MAINYDYIAINNHDYLLPIQGEVGMQQGKKQVVLNELHFGEYRRFGSHTRILDSGSMPDPGK
jgi:hypothetical protein